MIPIKELDAASEQQNTAIVTYSVEMEIEMPDGRIVMVTMDLSEEEYHQFMKDMQSDEHDTN